MASTKSEVRLVGNTEFYGGLSTDDKIGIENSYADGICLDVRKSPSQMSVLPQARELSDSGVITGLITAMCQTKDGTVWALDEEGQLYSISPEYAVAKILTPAMSGGHGLVYSQQRDALVFTDGDAAFYTYGPILNPRSQTRTVTRINELDDYSEYTVNSITKNYAGNYISNPDVPRNDAGTYGNVTENNPVYYDFSCPTAISETENDKALFLPGLSPIIKIGVYIKTKPASGNIKLVIHDVNDNVVAESSTINVSSITAGSYTEFTVLVNPNSPAVEGPGNMFENTPWTGATLEAGGEYHIHVLASVAGFELQTVTTDSNNNPSLYYGMRFTAKAKAVNWVFNRKHPMAISDKILIGNGRYVAELGASPIDYVDDTMYFPNRLRLDDGYEVCSIASTDEYVVIGAEKFSSDSSRGFQNGMIYFWDGQSDNPNFYIECPMGSPHAMFNYQNILYIIINGALYAYTGGKELIKVRTMRGTDTEYTGENTIHDVYPNMMAVRREILMIGFPSYTTSLKTRFGIHGWGSIDKNFPNCFTYNYAVPSATQGQYNTDDQFLRIGCVYNFGDTLFYGYEVTTTTHPEGAEPVTTVDPSLAVVDNLCGAATSFYWQSLVYDAGSPILEKSALRIGLYFNALPTGCTLTPIYRIDDGAVDFDGVQSIMIGGKKWYKGTKTATAGMKEVTCEVGGIGTKRIHEFQCGFIGTTTNGMTPPVIKQVVAEIKLNNNEAKI